MRNAATLISEFFLGTEERTVQIRSRLWSGLAGLVGLRLAFSALSFSANVLLARILGRDGLGAYAYALAWIVLLGAPAIVGFDQLLVREVATQSARSAWGLLRGLIRTAVQTVAPTSLLLSGAMALAVWITRSRWTSDALLTAIIALPLLPLITLTRVRQSIMQGLHQVVLGSVPERLVQPLLLLTFIAAGWVWRLHLTPPAAMTMNVAATGVAFLLGAWLLRRALPAASRQATPVYQRSIWIRSGARMMVLSGIAVVFSQADMLILGWLKGPGAAGLYSIADTGADFLTFVLVAQTSAFASTVVALHAEGDHQTLQRITTSIARTTLLATIPLAILFIGFGHVFLSRVYGVQFVHARGALAVLSLGQLINVATGLNGMLLVMTGHEGALARIAAASAVTNIALNLLLVPQWAMTGAAVANTISVIVWNVWATAALYRRTGIDSTPVGLRRARS